jgi:hypothetical protein
MLGIELTVRNTDIGRIVNRYIVSTKGAILITENNFKELLGKKVLIRSPMLCKAKSGFCETCLGRAITDNRDSLNLLGLEFGNMIQSVAMAAAHVGERKLVELDIMDLVH